MKTTLIHILPWLITAIALVLAFREIHVETLLAHMKDMNASWVGLAVLLTTLSYVFRARRWQYFFPRPVLSLLKSYRVLVLGFFMNNILPARTGELVRAHFGGVATGETRTLSLATIASERLADGLMISLFFVIFCLGHGDTLMSHELLLVAGLFGAVALTVMITLASRSKLFSVVDKLNGRFDSKFSSYTSDRLRVFVHGLSPLFSLERLPILVLWTIVVWSTELLVFYSVCRAYGADLPLNYVVLFLVTVNFASLIPAAPGGIGVIEAIGSKVLISLGVEAELALAMVITQHLIQFTVVGIAGVASLLSWKKNLGELTREVVASQ